MINNFDGNTVTFTISQKWTTDCSVDWIATTYNVNDEEIRCDKEKSIIPDQTFTYTASCIDNEALVTVYVYDDSFDTTDDPAVPAFCGDVDVEGNKVAYNFTLPCDCSSRPTTMTDASPSPAPTSVCDYFDVSFDDKDLVQGAYVSLQWKEYGFKMSASEFGDGTGGYMPNGYPRLFDASQPVDGNGYGTPGLAGDYGNVLIVQQTGGSSQWKANEAGGVISFEFASPVEEFLEIGLLNVVEEVWVQVTDANDATRTFVVSPGEIGSYKNVAMDVALVAKVDVYLPGPIAV